MVDYFGIVITIVFSILGWFWGRWMHTSMRPGESVYLSPILAWPFGNPRPNGVHNIRGIYFQILSFWFLFSFLYFDLGFISSKDAFRIFLAGLLILPPLELLRYLKKKLK